ncbi:hypothetical protein [Candidatus Lokiarchaeum ossiferum]|uniref:hypothetical protein n=1 Tax=Candidatus Lokiarchaeum ossiferum TaxID=2951803 RepID=UPI00352EAC8A
MHPYLQHTDILVNPSIILWTLLIDMFVIMWIIRDSYRRNMNPFFWSMVCLFSPFIAIIGHLLSRKPKMTVNNSLQQASNMERGGKVTQKSMEASSPVTIQVVSKPLESPRINQRPTQQNFAHTMTPMHTREKQNFNDDLKKFCPMCGSPVMPQGSYCGHCGYAL